MAGEFVADECEEVDAVGVDRMNKALVSYHQSGAPPEFTVTPHCVSRSCG